MPRTAAAMTRMGVLYHDALGVPRDPTEAARWWQRGAAAGDADGQAMLGAAHVLGSGVHSRLGTFVRTEKGYAYSIDAGSVTSRTYGYFCASARTDTGTIATSGSTGRASR